MGTKILTGNILCGLLLMGIIIGMPAYADEFDNAKKLVENFKKDEYDKVKKLTAEEVSMIVEALKNADDDDMKETTEYIIARVKSDAQANIEQFTKKYVEAKNVLDKLLADSQFKEKEGELKSLKENLDVTMLSLEKLTFRVKGGNHPVITWFNEIGKQAHKDYSDCDQKDFPTETGPVDCIKRVSDDDCRVIEIKPNNDRARGKAKENQLPRYLKSLNKKDSDYFVQLVSRDNKFSTCKEQFSGWWVLYKIEVGVDDEGNTPSPRYSFGSPEKVYDKGYK